MTYQQILEKAIQKAIDGGWEPVHPVYGPTYKGEWYILHEAPEDIARCFDPLEFDSRGYECLIFNHDFAKALWPNDKNGNIYWRMHLQRMVVSDDPIKYLEENI